MVKPVIIEPQRRGLPPPLPGARLGATFSAMRTGRSLGHGVPASSFRRRSNLPSAFGVAIVALAALMAQASCGARPTGDAATANVPPHLRGQKSPYLLQHFRSPVDWYPWGAAAFDRAKREHKPIFLSIGYSTCHWCHVMEHESFDDPQVAALMNKTFVSVVVDREERPDLDQRFMAASILLTGTAGWPLNVVMTPEGKPFFAATYIPRDTAYGRTGLLQLVPKIGEVWKSRLADIDQSADAIAAEMAKSAGEASSGYTRDPHALQAAVSSLSSSFDAEDGGFGRAPKFPMPVVYPLLFRSWYRDANAKSLAMAEQSLTAMRAGAIFDQLGFGFHRYATDAHWNAPHFEKMLYDQALLAIAYADAWQVTHGELYRRTAEEILAYVQRDLALPGGAFAAAEDADSQGEEGRFYLWTEEQIQAVLGPEKAAGIMRRYGVTGPGNFASQGGDPAGTSGHENVLHLEPALARSLLSAVPSSPAAPVGPEEASLLAARSGRPRPFRDDKVLADWNGLAIAALARAGSALGDPGVIFSAQSAAQFVIGHLLQNGRLLHRYRDGESAIPGFADDYAFLSWGLLELYEASFDTNYLHQAIRLMDALIAHFWDPSAGGFFQTADDAGEASERRKSLTDGALPSANSVALLVLLWLNRITGNQDYEKRAEAIIGLYPTDAASRPLEFSFFLGAADFSAGPSFEVVVAGDPGAPDTEAMLGALRGPFLPNAVVIFRPTATSAPSGGGRTGLSLALDIRKLAPFTESQVALNGKATAYVCQNFVCSLPTTDVRAMLSELRPR